MAARQAFGTTANLLCTSDSARPVAAQMQAARLPSTPSRLKITSAAAATVLPISVHSTRPLTLAPVQVQVIINDAFEHRPHTSSQTTSASAVRCAQLLAEFEIESQEQPGRTAQVTEAAVAYGTASPSRALTAAVSPNQLPQVPSPSQSPAPFHTARSYLSSHKFLSESSVSSPSLRTAPSVMSSDSSSWSSSSSLDTLLATNSQHTACDQPPSEASSDDNVLQTSPTSCFSSPSLSSAQAVQLKTSTASIQLLPGPGSMKSMRLSSLQAQQVKTMTALPKQESTPTKDFTPVIDPSCLCCGCCLC